MKKEDKKEKSKENQKKEENKEKLKENKVETNATISTSAPAVASNSTNLQTKPTKVASDKAPELNQKVATKEEHPSPPSPPQ